MAVQPEQERNTLFPIGIDAIGMVVDKCHVATKVPLEGAIFRLCGTDDLDIV